MQGGNSGKFIFILKSLLGILLETNRKSIQQQPMKESSGRKERKVSPNESHVERLEVLLDEVTGGGVE